MLPVDQRQCLRTLWSTRLDHPKYQLVASGSTSLPGVRRAEHRHRGAVTYHQRMTHVQTTATLISKMKTEAKALVRESGTPLHACLETVAKRHGYNSWKHVNESRAATESANRAGA